MPLNTSPSSPGRRAAVLGMGGAGLFLLGALAGAIGVHLWSGAHDLRKTVSTVAFIQDWQLNCPPLAQSGTGCALRQTLVQKGTTTPIAQLQIERGVNADVIKIVVPLGVLVGPGLAFTADGAPPAAIPYVTCDFSGCIAVAPLTNDQRDKMEHGTGGQITVVGRSGKPVNLPYSLKGFAEAIGERDRDWHRRTGGWF
jgi:invasion protein IalB